jgi:hypothetical protein
MSGIFDLAYAAAQKTLGPKQWERISDAERIRAVSAQISKMTREQVGGRQLFEDGLTL